MYLWRFTIAIILGLVWYFSDSARVVTLYLVGILCYLATPHIFFINIGRESGTQTDEAAEEKVFQERTHVGLCEKDAFDDDDDTMAAEMPLGLQYPEVKRSLLQVFECIYAQLVLPWYAVPEPSHRQPLHHVLWKEFDYLSDQIISRARRFDVRAASVGCIRILTQHVHNAQQSDREPLFSSREEEVAVLRVFSDALVRNLFSQSLWELDVNHCALNEIVALKVLELLVTWLSDPDNLNLLVVGQMDGGTPKSSVEELWLEPRAAAAAAQDNEDENNRLGMTDDGAEESQASNRKCNKKANKLKEGWDKLVYKMKSKKAKKKKMKKMEQELLLRVMDLQGCPTSEEEATSRESSIHSQHDSDSEDGSDLEDYLSSVQEDMMEFKLSYEMWRVGHWAVSVLHAESDCEELCFTIHLEERDNPENLHWDVRKTQTDVIYFRNRWQDAAHFPSLAALEDGSELADDDTRERARTSLERFLQELVSDDQLGHSQPVFQFLCPLDKLMNEEVHYGGVWGLLSGLAYFLTPGQEEDEVGHHHSGVQLSHNDHRVEAAVEAAPHDLGLPCSEIHLPDASEIVCDNGGDTTNTSVPTIIISECAELSNSDEPAEKADLLNDSAQSSQADKTEDSENPLTSHLKKIILKGLNRSRSEESLVSPKETIQDEQDEVDCKPSHTPNGGSLWDLSDVPSWLHFGGKLNKTKERVFPKMSVGLDRSKGKDQGTLIKGEESHCLKKDQSGCWEQLEATKAIFDLLKEISGNSILLNIFDAMLKPVMPILKKKVNSFLDKINPTEAQMASYIDNLREKQWPEGSPAPSRPHRSSEEKNETRDRAHHLINAKYSNYLLLKKTDMENVFKLFQDSEENKKLVYMLFSFLLREFLPGEDALNVTAMVLQKVNAI